MAKPRNPVESEKILVTTTPYVRRYLEHLVAGGLYGKNVSEAAERLIARSIESLVREGILKRLSSTKTKWAGLLKEKAENVFLIADTYELTRQVTRNRGKTGPYEKGLDIRLFT